MSQDQGPFGKGLEKEEALPALHPTPKVTETVTGNLPKG